MTAAKNANLYHINGMAITTTNDTMSTTMNVTTNDTANATSSATSAAINMANGTSDIQLWHRHLGHVGTSNLQCMINHQSVYSLLHMKGEIMFCEECAINTPECMPERMPKCTIIYDPEYEHSSSSRGL